MAGRTTPIPPRKSARPPSAGIAIVTQDDEDYPAPLRDTYDPPLLLYVWGKIEPRDRHAIGVVGSRRATHYGTQTTKKLSYQLAQAGFTIISGLARGIDTAAHEAAIAANGRTIAVIGSGPGQTLSAGKPRRSRKKSPPATARWFPSSRSTPRRTSRPSRCATASSPPGRARC